MQKGLEGKKRCFGHKPGQAFYAHYHDYEWAVPVHDDRILFEMLILEGAQAGLSWETVLKKREGYRHAFHQFNVKEVATMTDAALDILCENPDIIRNRRKIYATRRNARVFLKIQTQFESFDRYLWRFVKGQPIINHWQTLNDVPITTPDSYALSDDLNKRGMIFVGPVIIYAYMQAVGLVNDHLMGCWCYGR